MGLVEQVVSLGRAGRSRKNLKVRQPLSRLMVRLPKHVGYERVADYLPIVRDELNIKEIVAADDIDRYVTYQAKLNFKSAGPKLGQAVKRAAQMVTALSSEEVRRFAESGKLELTDNGTTYVLTADDVEVIRNEEEGFAVESEGPVTVALATTLTEELINEGFARELVNKIQNMRKTSGFEVTDRIEVQLSGTDRLLGAVRQHEEFIRRETLADRIEIATEHELASGVEWNINGEPSRIAVGKVKAGVRT